MGYKDKLIILVSILQEIRRTKNYRKKKISFSDLSMAEKLEDSKDLEELLVKTKKMISKATDTMKSLRTAATKLDDLWKTCRCKTVHATLGVILGGILSFTGGIRTKMIVGSAAPLLLSGIVVGFPEAGANVLTSCVEASINSLAIKEAEKNLQDIRDSINDVNNTIHMWLKTKKDVNLLYICCLAAVTQDRNDLLIKLLENVVLRTLMLSVNDVGVTGRVALSSGVRVFVADVAVQSAAQAVTKGLASSGAKAAVSESQAAGQVASKLMIGVKAALVVWDDIDLTYTIKDIVQDKGSDAARSLRLKADELERAFLITSKD